MRNRASYPISWLAAVAALAAAVAAVTSPRVRAGLTSAAVGLANTVNRNVDGLRARMEGGMGRRIAALEDLSGTFDTASTQYMSSMTVSKVATALPREPRLRGQNVGVRIIGGILHLEGSVRSDEDRELAAEIARRASGAQLVANDLTTASTIS